MIVCWLVADTVKLKFTPRGLTAAFGSRFDGAPSVKTLQSHWSVTDMLDPLSILSWCGPCLFSIHCVNSISALPFVSKASANKYLWCGTVIGPTLCNQPVQRGSGGCRVYLSPKDNMHLRGQVGIPAQHFSFTSKANSLQKWKATSLWIEATSPSSELRINKPQQQSRRNIRVLERKGQA